MKHDDFYAFTRFRRNAMQMPLFSTITERKLLWQYWLIIHEFRRTTKNALWRWDWFIQERPHIVSILTALQGEYTCIMAKQPKFDSGYEFINLRIDSETKAEFDKWARQHAEDYFVDFHQLIVAGWKHSLSWDDANQCFIASMTCNSEGSRYYRKVFTGRADAPDEAILLVLYKVLVIAPNADLSSIKSLNNWG